MFIAAKEFGYHPQVSLDMPVVYEWALIEGLNDYYEAQRGEAGSQAYDDDYDPRFPRASRGDMMASPEELMGLGIQYSRE